MTVKDKIHQIISNRQNSLGGLRHTKEKCDANLNTISELIDLINSCAKLPNIPNTSIDFCNQALQVFTVFRTKIYDLKHKIERCENKFNRNTINVGFGGKKGTGKSFLLQMLSGLSDNEVPSAMGLPVTAVSSRIFNANKQKAIVEFYTEEDFLQSVIHPYCEKLEDILPRTIQDFLQMSFEEDSDDFKNTLRKKLKEFQLNKDAFVSNLTGQTLQESDFSDIRKYVAYTDTNGQKIFNYLAVKKVDMHCPFPKAEVADLDLIDLPGLGELNPTIESRHTDGFDEADVLLVIRRPAGTRVDWDEQDSNALKVLTNGAPVDKHENFLLFVHNEGDCDENNIENSIKSVQHALGNKYEILRTKEKTSDGLSCDILQKVLERLTVTLPEMDKEQTDYIAKQSIALWQSLDKVVNEAHELVKCFTDGEHESEVHYARGKECHEKFSGYCVDIRTDLERVYEDDRILDKIQEIEEYFEAYFQTGMQEKDIDTWLENRANEIAKEGSEKGVFVEQANIMRVDIAKVFSELDTVYEDITDDVLQKVCQAFDYVLPNFFTKDTARENLESLLHRIEQDDLSLIIIRDALKTMLELKIEHNTQFYPRAYEPIRRLRKHIKDEPTSNIYVGKDRHENARTMLKSLEDLGRKAITDMSDMLKEVTLSINNIILVAFEYFDDRVIRHKEAETQWYRLVLILKDLWEPAENREHERALRKILMALKELKKIN